MKYYREGYTYYIVLANNDYYILYDSHDVGWVFTKMPYKWTDYWRSRIILVGELEIVVATGKSVSTWMEMK